MHASDALTEGDRLMTVCNACRYCEGLCAVFPAMEARRTFPDGDLNYLANLCHNCGACYYACQFSPPHQFNVNIPRTLARVRAESYAAYAWPRMLSAAFKRNGLTVTVGSALSIAGFIAGFVALGDPRMLVGVETGAGAFYRLMPHQAMVWIFGLAFLYACVSLAYGVRRFWRDVETPQAVSLGAAVIWRAIKDAGRLRYLNGSGEGCMTEDEQAQDRRRLFHHFTFYGFLLCFAATAVATLYHYLLGREAPYPWYDLPVVLGTLGGIGLVIGPSGLLATKIRRDPAIVDDAQHGMDAAFLAMLMLVAVTGLALLVLRGSSAMGLLLAVHLGSVLGLFAAMPYGKFVHGIYRFAALVRYAMERHAVSAQTTEQ